MADAKPRRSIFDTLKRQAGPRLGLAAAAEVADKISRFPPPPPEQENPAPGIEEKGQDKGAEQRGRTKGQDKRAVEQNKGAVWQDKGAGQKGSSFEQDKEAGQRGSSFEHDKGAGQRGSSFEQDKRAEQKGSTAYVPVLLKPQSPARTSSQKRVWAYFEQHGDHVTNYEGIIAELRIPYNTLRKEIDRLVTLGYLTKTRWAQGSARGLRFAFHGQQGQDKGAEQRGSTFEQDKGAGQRGRTFEQDKGAGQRGTPIKKIDRKNLSISLETVRIKWPTLARAGFGPEQLAQIEAVRTETGEPCDRVVQGLDHLEYELAHDLLRDKAGQPVADPCSWAFRALAKNGYYRRPKGYVSPEEQAVRDAEVEAKAVTAARQQADQARFEAWRDALTPDELAQAMQGHPGGDKGAWLKKVWRERS